MSSEDLEYLAISYLLGELNEPERTDFEVRMASDQDLEKLVDELEKSMGLAAVSQTGLAEPSSALRDRLLAATPDREVSLDAVDRSEGGEKVSPFPVAKVTIAVVGWAAAACLALVYLNQSDELQNIQAEKDSVVTENETLQSRVEELEEVAATSQTSNEELAASVDEALANNVRLQEQLEQLSLQLADVNTEVENLESMVTRLRQQSVLDKVQIAALSSEVDELRYGFAVWDMERDQGIVKVFNLQTLDLPNQDYQFWVISPEQEAPIPAGVFQVDELGRAEYAFTSSVPVSSVGAFAISLEPKGGSPAPTGPIVLSGAL